MSDFFSKPQIHNAIWALVIAGIGFGGGLVWKHYSGPDEVKVVSDTTVRRDTVINIIKLDPAIQLSEQQIAKNSAHTEHKLEKGSESQKATYQLSAAQVNLMIEKALARKQKNKPSIIPVSSTTPAQDNSIVALRPKFNLPSKVEGYIQDKINTYATVDINKTTFSQNESIELTTTFFKNNTLEIVTPIFAAIDKKNSATSVTQIWSDQFQPKEAKTKIKFSASFPPGTYNLVVGFYLKNELTSKYPPLYSKTFLITII